MKKEEQAIRRQRCKKDERDVQMEVESRSRAAEYLVIVAELFCIVCAVRRDPTWRGFLSVVLAGLSAMLYHRYGYDRERPWLYAAAAFCAASAGFGLWFLLG